MVANNGSTILNSHMNSGYMTTLNIHVPRDNIKQPMQFDVQMLIGDICRNIREHLPITIEHDRKKKKVLLIKKRRFMNRIRLWTFCQ
jgi:hypothetical protein